MSARARLLLAGILLSWGVLQLARAWPDSLVDDWHGWRQADTQAIARNFHQGGLELFHPRIDWGGDGPGYVEAELQLVPALIALAMGVTGESERIGQLLALACFLASAAVLAAILARRHGELAGLLGALALLASRSTVFLGFAVMPEPLMVLLYLVGLGAFLRAADARSSGWLALAAVATAGAGLLKPTALALGLTQLAFVALARRDLLRWPALWAAWLFVLLAVGAHLLHAQSLYQEYGNTFGVMSGGDLKFPQLEHLLAPGSYRRLAEVTWVWGLGPAGALAGLYLAARRRLSATEWALALGTAAGLLIALRYTANPYLGRHYHVFATVLGAWLFGHAAADLVRALAAPRARALAVAGAVAALLALLGVNLAARARQLPGPTPSATTQLARAFAALPPEPGLVVVRSPSADYDPAFRTENNYQDPRLFYLARVRGWSVPRNRDAPAEFEGYAARGARYYLEPRLEPRPAGSWPALHRWLAEHAERVHEGPAGSIWRLPSPSGR